MREAEGVVVHPLPRNISPRRKRSQRLVAESPRQTQTVSPGNANNEVALDEECENGLPGSRRRGADPCAVPDGPTTPRDDYCPGSLYRRRRGCWRSRVRGGAERTRGVFRVRPFPHQCVRRTYTRTPGSMGPNPGSNR